jgi:hypothetical protein
MLIYTVPSDRFITLGLTGACITYRLEVGRVSLRVVSPPDRFEDHRAIEEKRSDKTIHDMVHLTPETARLIQVADDLLGLAAIGRILQLEYVVVHTRGQLVELLLSPSAHVVLD